jgi:protein-disulfide isomerase
MTGKAIGILLGLATALCASLAPVAPAQDLERITVAGQQQMLRNPGTAPAGAKDADLTIVEYFDYNCPYCKKLAPTFQSLLAADRKVSILYKDWPIFGGISVYAAKSALAAQWQGRYLAAHDALISGPRLANEDQVDELLRQADVDIVTLRKDMVAHANDINAMLTRNNDEARALGLRGTPGIVVGRYLLPGTVDLSTLEGMLAQARRNADRAGG